jgi:hypothetical protein
MASARYSERRNHGWHRGWDRYDYRRGLSLRATREAIGSLLEHLEAYDRLRLTLEQLGGTVADLQRITSHLQMPVPIRGGFADGVAKLTEQAKLQGLLRDVHDGIRLDVRQRPSGMPVYYVCRIQADYWSDSRLIAEDYYLSSGYPLADERFVRLMRSGHEVFFLRLSPLRGAAKLVFDKSNPTDDEIDDALFDAGQLVLQSAWHEDQRMASKVSRCFHLPCALETIELLYLCLSADLSGVRDGTSPRVLRFFEQVYPQPAIRGLLGMLGDADGTAIAEFPRRAKRRYGKLLTAFGKFLATEIPWGRQNMQTPLWKLIYANYGRLQIVGDALRDHPAVCAARTTLEAEAATIRENVLAQVV